MKKKKKKKLSKKSVAFFLFYKMFLKTFLKPMRKVNEYPKNIGLRDISLKTLYKKRKITINFL